MPFRNISIKNKLTIVILLVAMFAIVVNFSINLIMEHNSLKAKLVNQSVLNAKLVSEYCITALDFGYTEEANDILSKLSTIPSVLNAHVYDSDRNLFASFDRFEKIKVPPIPSALTSTRFSDRQLDIFQRIEFNNNIKGTLYLRISTAELTNELTRQLIINIYISVGIVILVYILAIRTQKYISKPILALAKTSEQISKSNDYSVRIEKFGNDEIGQLYDSFNQMLDKIHIRESERNLATQALRESEKKHRTYIRNAPDSILVTNSHGKYIDVNNAASEMTGYSKKELLNMTVKDLDSPNSPIDTMDIIKELQKKGKANKVILIRRKDGKDINVSVSAVKLSSDQFMGFCADITEKIRMEEMMIQSEKMLSVGGLAAGMAHEINNPLAGMMQTAHVLGNRLGNSIDIPANQKAALEAGTTIEAIKKFMEARGIPRMLNTINESGKRVVAIVNNMLSFARKGESISSTVDLVDLLDRTLELASTDYDLKKHHDFKKININKKYSTDIPPVICESAKIQQVLLNVLRNGAQAMQDSQTASPQLDIVASFEPDTNMVSLSVSDNGPGMSEETRKRVFEPFFTTKPVGVGTGLGLSVSYFIVTEIHNGEMSVKSAINKGTTFTIKLPVQEKSL